MHESLPTISILIPTLNAEKTLGECLTQISRQDYPKDKIEIIVADGGSTDGTIALASQFGAIVTPNPLKTGEAGKAAALKIANNELIALIDSDNYLPSPDWLSKMVQPFADPEIIGSEPLEYTYRPTDGLITRYCALLGMNDPICLFLGNYDRYCHLTGRWTDMPVRTEDKGAYYKLTLEKNAVPTIGANGTLIRRSLIADSVGDYLFDIDEIYGLMLRGCNKFAKVKIGIIHVFSGTVSTFIRKQKRRIRDYAYYQKLGVRKYPWDQMNVKGLLTFILYAAFWLPTFCQACRGYLKIRDKAWFFHPLACWLTLWVYGTSRIAQHLFGTKEMDRQHWTQQ